jgi:thiol-disulfide isomerase/thioredoxin
MKVIQHMTDAVDAYDPCNYNAQMRFKEMGGDTFETRNFSISYKSNTANPLYGYDWEITEERHSGYEFTHMVLPNAIYVIYEGTKIIGKGNLPQKIDLASFTEYIRSSFVLREVISPFVSVSPVEIGLMDSGKYYYLTRQMNEMATRRLSVTKDTYLPIQSINTIRDIDFNFAQITEINFFHDEHKRGLPDTAFSPDHYVTLGYTLKLNEDAESSKETEMNTISPESREFLLNYRFVTETGDTTSLRSSKAGYILLDFWYASCMPCLQALPMINQLAEDYADEGMAAMGINCSDKGIRANVATKLRAKNITIPLLFGSRDLIQSLKITSFPSYILITPDRHVVFIEGYIDDVKKVLNLIFEK